ncbi:hypothetical protein N0V93_002812 [Gnomoniopsis smithogilvyi]|uniref:Enoyl reductase (ER) domain-containing protein n=1 Tax=Gnomoniopsis smithogilvyi TaxID=1191159 RepID=A0A9W9CZI5_9PEZI|nr:hypothetical protein N0V93_002812 [Gnomoniopsis smithogilvyi]
MRALRYYGHKDIRLEEIPEPQCRPNCIKIKPTYVGICGSDIHLYFEETVATKPDYCHPLAGEPMPIVFGHEFGGVVTEIGDGVTRARVGDLVAIRPSLYDGTCEACVEGISNVCRHWGWLGIHANGGLAEFAVVDQKLAFCIPKGIRPEVSALVEPLAVAWHATTLAQGLNANSTVLITGGGPIGCAVFMALKAQGLRNIVVSEVSDARRNQLKGFGAKLVFNPEETDLTVKVKEMTGGWGAHAAFDCAGLPVTLNTCLAALRPRGTIVNVALRGKPLLMNLNDYIWKEVTLVSSNAYVEEDWENVITALGNGTLTPDALVTRKIALPDLVEKGIKMLAQPGQKDCKILVDVQGSNL